jgi:hypothetical protein
MSTIQTNSITDAAGTGAPDFPNGLEVSAGNVGIGTSSPTEELHIYSTDNPIVLLEAGPGTDSRLRLLTANDRIGYIEFGDTDDIDTGEIRYDHSSNKMFFATNGNVDRMVIDSSGTVLIGKTTADSGATSGIEFEQVGLGRFTRASTTAVFDRLSTEGVIATFRKDGTTVGDIGVASGELFVDGVTGDCGIQFGGFVWKPRDNGAAADNAVDIGNATFRFDDIYATNNVIQTSDRNEKQDIEELNDAERRVAVACKGLMRKYRWKSAVAEKGEEARIHFGIIAQDLQAAFAAEGLDAGRYAMFISSTWWEHDGKIYDTAEEAPEGATERTRLGVRYPELLAFMIAVL